VFEQAGRRKVGQMARDILELVIQEARRIRNVALQYEAKRKQDTLVQETVGGEHAEGLLHVEDLGRLELDDEVVEAEASPCDQHCDCQQNDIDAENCLDQKHMLIEDDTAMNGL
jgi:hypothetical protein